MLKDLGPCFDSVKVILDTAAVLEVLREFLNDFSNKFNTLDNVWDISFFKISNCILNILSKVTTIFQTLLNLWEVILSDEAIDDTSDKVSNISWSHSKTKVNRLLWLIQNI